MTTKGYKLDYKRVSPPRVSYATVKEVVEVNAKYPCILLTSEEEYINTVKRADGQYTIIIVTSQKSYVFVDHMRSFPVFYWMENSK